MRLHLQFKGCVKHEGNGSVVEEGGGRGGAEGVEGGLPGGGDGAGVIAAGEGVEGRAAGDVGGALDVELGGVEVVEGGEDLDA